MSRRGHPVRSFRAATAQDLAVFEAAAAELDARTTPEGTISGVPDHPIQWPAHFDQLVQLYRPYFTRIRQGVGYDETYDRSDAGISRFVPPFAVRRDLA